MAKLGVGIYGGNGHQIHRQLSQHQSAKLVACCEFERDRLPDNLKSDDSIRHYHSLDELIADKDVELISLCSPVRREQAEHAIRCLRAGKHVYAEKPVALSEAEVDEIVQVAWESGRKFHEMAGTVFEQPYRAMQQIVQQGTIGQVIHVISQKSYPWNDGRPQNEDIDGGLTLQVGVHAVRMVEHITGIPVRDVQAMETSLGNPLPGQIRMAANILMRLQSGALAVSTMNYLNPRGFRNHGNEMVRIWGSKGMIESTDAGKRTRLIVGEQDRGPLNVSEPSLDYFDLIVEEILEKSPMPLTLEQELHPLRVVIRARDAARKN